MIDLFLESEVAAAKKIVATAESYNQAKIIQEKIITENVMRRIASETGQPNDRKYMAYRLLFLATQ